MSSDPAIDREARRLYEAVVQQATAYARYYVDRDRARDVAQDVAVAIVTRHSANPAAFDERHATRGYIHRVLINYLCNERRGETRRARKHGSAMEDPGGDDPD